VQTAFFSVLLVEVGLLIVEHVLVGRFAMRIVDVLVEVLA
jgi:hypothetical protein